MTSYRYLLQQALSLYADDVMLYCFIRSQIDFLALQVDVDSLSVWTDDNHLNFNTEMQIHGHFKKETRALRAHTPRALHLHYRVTWTYAVDDLYLLIRGQCA